MTSAIGPEGQVSHPSPERDRVSPARLFLAATLAPGAWLAQLTASYFFASEGCDPTNGPAYNPVVPGLWLLLLLINLACAAAGAMGAYLAWSCWRRTRREKSGGKGRLLDIGEGRTRFSALSALIVSFIFGLAICAEAAALLILERCSPGSWF